jgi:hypothetical protein
LRLPLRVTEPVYGHRIPRLSRVMRALHFSPMV